MEKRGPNDRYDRYPKNARFHVYTRPPDKLNQIGVHGKMWLLLKNFLDNRKVRLKLDDCESEEFLITEGLPQGSVLSPILFSIFVSDIAYLCVGSNFKYANDLTFLVTGVSVSDSCHKMQSDLNRVSSWLNDWRILRAPDKTDQFARLSRSKLNLQNFIKFSINYGSN